ncbi:MAG: quinolinate synthase NadA [Candidatus Asgardarchaeia archaeon]
MMNVNEIVRKIKELKEEKDAVILAHNYQSYEVQELADFVGDSLGLSLKSMEVDAKIIVFAGVKFMAEQAKVLNPKKKVLIPDPGALCSLAAMVDEEVLKGYREKYPDAPLIVYVNSPISVKSMADYIVTSSNAADVIEKVDSDIVLFSPDANLASYISKKTSKEIIPVPPTGHCYVHLLITPHDIERARKLHPDAVVIVHGEVPEESKELADFVGSTGQMIKFVAKSKEKKFLIGTEVGMINRLRRDFPDKEFIPVVENDLCIGMKKITVEKILSSLEKEVYEVSVREDVAKKIREAILRTYDLIGVKRNVPL